MDSKIIFWAFVRQFASRGVHHQKGGVDAVSVVVFAYDIYTNPQKQRGAPCNAYR
jgi:hypothetical protein